MSRHLPSVLAVKIKNAPLRPIISKHKEGTQKTSQSRFSQLQLGLEFVYFK